MCRNISDYFEKDAHVHLRRGLKDNRIERRRNEKLIAINEILKIFESNEN